MRSAGGVEYVLALSITTAGRCPPARRPRLAHALARLLSDAKHRSHSVSTATGSETRPIRKPHTPVREFIA